MFQQFIMLSVNTLFAVLTPEKIKSFIAAGADRLKKYVEDTETTMDDKLVIPAVNLVLAALEIPGRNGAIDITGELRKLFDALGELSSIFIDAGLDYIEDSVVESESKIDDQIILPTCNLIRTVLKVPDNDENQTKEKE